MITATRLRSDLDNALDVLLEADVAILRNPVVIRGGSLVGWPRAGTGTEVPARFGSVEEYFAQLDTSAYSAILLDASLLQIEYELQGGRVTGHRLAYYPCPFQVDAELLREFQTRDAVEASASIEMMRLRTPWRFDYAPLHSKRGHPACHAHFNHEECRFAVATPVAPAAFLRFVLANFYPDCWHKDARLHMLAMAGWRRTITAIEESDWHLNCASRGSGAY